MTSIINNHKTAKGSLSSSQLFVTSLHILPVTFKRHQKQLKNRNVIYSIKTSHAYF